MDNTRNKIRILFLHNSMNMSGAVRQLTNIMESLDRNSFESFLIIRRSDRISDNTLLKRDNVFVINDISVNVFTLVYKFIKLVKQIKPDCIQTFNRHSNWLGYIGSFFYKSPPIVSSMRNTNIKLRFILIEMLLKSRFRFIVVNSKAIFNELHKRSFIPVNKIKIIPNGLDTNIFTPFTKERIDQIRNTLNITNKKTLFLTAGRIHPQKNILCTLKALKELKMINPEFNFMFIHIGPVVDHKYSNAVLNYVYENNLQGNCLFEKETDRVVEYYNAADAVIISSSWEGLPNVLIEAMACCKPCLVADSADNDNIIIPGENGYLFTKNNYKELARLMIYIGNLSMETKLRMGHKARGTVVNRFSMRFMASSFETLYRQVAQNSQCVH